jgi:hypothetical protein
MGNEVYNNLLIRGPEKDLDEIAGGVGSCGSLTVERMSKHCLRIRNSIRQKHLWDEMTGMLRTHKDCWIFNHFVEELNGGKGIWIGFYQAEQEVIQSRFWEGPCAEHMYALCSGLKERKHLRDKLRKLGIEAPPSQPPTPILSNSDIVYENKIRFGGTDPEILFEMERPVWDIKKESERDFNCNSINTPITTELLKGFDGHGAFLQNRYRCTNGTAGVWVAWDTSYDNEKQEFEHLTWQELSKEEIDSFEAFGINKVQKKDAYLCADPIEWFWKDVKKRYLNAKKGGEMLQVWFATGAT